jgi:hypothetical protein
MDRDLLHYFLSSGPTRRLDLLTLSRGINPTLAPGPDLMFRIPFLNKSIVFKYLDLQSRASIEDASRIRTLVFMPYDLDRPGDGGESFIYSEPNLKAFCEMRAGGNRINPNLIQQDLDLLRVIDSVPTLNPFLLEDAFEREHLDVPSGYFDLEPEVREQIRNRLRSRIRPLIVAALGGSPGKVQLAIDEMSERFMKPDSLDAVAPMIAALRLPPEDALIILNAWAGITYYEGEYAAMHKPLKRFAMWMNQFPMPKEHLMEQERIFIQERVVKVKKDLRNSWNDALSILREYQGTYKDLVEDGRAGGFIDFLRRSKDLYWRLGDLLGRLEQSIYAWKSYTRNYPGQRLPFRVLSEFYEVLSQANADGVDPEKLGAEFDDDEFGIF